MKNHPLAPTPSPDAPRLGRSAPAPSPAARAGRRPGPFSFEPASAAANRKELLLRFALRLAEERPRSVLDVGAGRGDLGIALRRARVPVTSTETTLPAAQHLARLGFRVLVARAEALPLGHRSVDWVALRHVCHHLPDLDLALAEAVRVARSGLAIAEPWYDRSMPSQVLAERIERWRRRQHRRLGRVHADDVSVGELIERLPERDAFDFRVETVLRPRRVPRSEIETALLREAQGLGREHPDRDELRQLLAELHSGAPTWNGSAVLVARRVRG